MTGISTELIRTVVLVFFMMQRWLFLSVLHILCNTGIAQRVTGRITDADGKALPFASLLVKGTTLGTTANNQGDYFLELAPGKYTLIAQYVGYQRQEKQLLLTEKPGILNFSLERLELSLKEVVVRPNAEDPAYEIMRNAIRKRPDYENPLDSFTCEAYIKTLIRTRKLPDRIMGQKIEQEDKRDMGVDSAGKGILFLSESLTRIAFKKPNKMKLEVLSGRQSGSNGYGFNFPSFINFYNNNVTVFTSQISPRGFVSPVASGAMGFYHYHYLGSFFEEGKEINQIEVRPKRKFEPLFSGIINITEGDWRIHSLELMVTKEAQLELMDTLRIKQIHVPVTSGVWQVKDQVIDFSFNFLGIQAVGSFLNVYNKYETEPAFRRRYFNNVVVQYDTAVNKKSRAYWDSIRPLPLDPEEATNFHTRDSSFSARQETARSPATIDSLRRHQRPVTVKSIFWNGFGRSNFSPVSPSRLDWEPLLRLLEYNTAEGLVAQARFSVRKYLPALKRQVQITPLLRYGFSNTHLNGSVALTMTKRAFTWDEEGGTLQRRSWTLEGGKKVSQYNRNNPISPLVNSLYTLLDRRNYLKNYESWFGELRYFQRTDNGWQYQGYMRIEDRLPLENTSNFSIFGSRNTKLFTPNYPFEKINAPFDRHQAMLIGASVQFQPGQRYIQFPQGKRPIGSKYPTLALAFEKGIKKLLGSDADFDKWQFSVWDDMNLKLAGKLQYRFGLGGFLNKKTVAIQDYQHFNGNQLFFASEYRNSFQLAPYYSNSTVASLYATAHLEHHFNGLLTNKIPFFRRLNWYLVGGSNAFYVNRENNYVELFAGLENILKVLRVDLVAAYLNGNKASVAVRLGMGGLLGNAVRIGR